MGHGMLMTFSLRRKSDTKVNLSQILEIHRPDVGVKIYGKSIGVFL
jgi:hypothetical protein